MYYEKQFRFSNNSHDVYAVTLLFILIITNKAKHLNAESCISSSAYYDSPDHSFLSDIDPDFLTI